VNIAANAGTKSVLTAKVGGATVTHPAWEVAITAAAGTRSGVTPTAANAVLAGQVIEVASDGGSSAVTPAMYSIVVRGAPDGRHPGKVRITVACGYGDVGYDLHAHRHGARLAPRERLRRARDEPEPSRPAKLSRKAAKKIADGARQLFGGNNK
jgi:hypothetical protein